MTSPQRKQTRFDLASALVVTGATGVFKNMVPIKLKIVVVGLTASVALAASGWVAQQALAQKPSAPQKRETKDAPVAAAPADEVPHASKIDLTPESSAKLRAAIRPQRNEWRHLQVHWYTDIVAAHKKAAAEDKPILVFRTGGAGYNDPLGQC